MKFKDEIKKCKIILLYLYFKKYIGSFYFLKISHVNMYTFLKFFKITRKYMYIFLENFKFKF